MGTSERKERERQAREALILDAAHRTLVAHGHLGLNLDALADEVQYAKGTLYLHFRSKEDLILGVAVRNMERRAGLFERALALRGGTRERAMALAMADVAMQRVLPGHLEVEQAVRSRALWERTSPERRAALGAAEGRCLAAVARVVAEAQHAGDLGTRGGTPEQVAFTLWAMAYGTYLLAGTSEWALRLAAGGAAAGAGDGPPIPRPRRGRAAGRRRGAGAGLVVAPGQSQEAYLDGLGWRPLSDEFDYRATERRIARELFAAELGG